MQTYLSLFSGIGGFDCGLDRAGLRCVGQVEREANCLKVLAKHWPDVPKIKDVHDVDGTFPVRPDWIVGGFPCQDLSVAGRRSGLAGKRSGLFFEFIRIIKALAPSGVLIENVPGLLSSAGGRDMGAVVGGLADLGYGVVWRVLDAQWFGVAQQRRRVFIVGCAGADVRRAAEVLFERDSLPWHPPPRREAGAGTSPSVIKGAAIGREPENGPQYGEFRTDGTCYTLNCTEQHAVADALTSEGHDTSEDGTGRGVPLVPIRSSGCANSNGLGIGKEGEPMTALDTTGNAAVAFTPFTFDPRQVTSKDNRAPVREDGPCGTLHETAQAVVFDWQSGGDVRHNVSEHHTSALQASQTPAVMRGGVRRLTPKECARLQGFPDDWLDGLGLRDSAKYRALGNAVCVNVAEWIARRMTCG